MTKTKTTTLELGSEPLEILAKLKEMIDAGRGEDEVTTMMAIEGDDPAPQNQPYLTGTVREVYAKFIDIARTDPNPSQESAHALMQHEGVLARAQMKASMDALNKAQHAIGEKKFAEAKRALDEAERTEADVVETGRMLEREGAAEIERVLERNRKLLALARSGVELFSPGEFEATTEAALDRALHGSRQVRNSAVPLAHERRFVPLVKELDAQIDELASFIHVEAPDDAGAGKVRVLDETRLARDPHSQVRLPPLRDRIAQRAAAAVPALRDQIDAAAGKSEARQGISGPETEPLSDQELNAGARQMIQDLTGRPLIKVIDGIISESMPDLMKAFYPRIYENVGRYCSPRDCAVMIANVVSEMLRYGPGRIPTAYQLLMPALRYLRDRRMPMFFIAPDLLEAVQRTDFDDDIDWTDLELPYESGIFILPKGALIHPKDGEMSMLIWTRQRKGDHPSPWRGLPGSTTGNDSFVILGACLGPMIWYDSIFTANVRPTIRLHNLFYREAGQPIPATRKVTKLDADLTEEDSDFVEKMGVIVFGTILVMNDRPKLVGQGKLLKRVGGGEKPLREFWSPNIIGEEYKVKREIAKIVDRKFVVPERGHGTHASPRLHWRRGHHRNQPVGPGRKERKRIWIEPCIIGAGEDDE